VSDWEQLVRQAAGVSPSETIENLLTSETQEATQRRDACATQLGNLAATLGDLANALRETGRLDEALSKAEHGVAINRALGHNHSVAAGLGQTAKILMEQGYYHKADSRFDQALDAARRIGDRGLEAALLQHQGSLAERTNKYNRAVELYKQALRLFQDANDTAGIMLTCNLLGIVEQKEGRLSEAKAWYERSREIAQHRGDTTLLGVAAQNIGVVCQLEGQEARQRGDEITARQWFGEAEQSLQEGLKLKIEQGNKPLEATACGQLSQVYLLMDALDQAEEYAHRAREIHESLGLKEVHREYHTLAAIARARGNEAQAVQWEARRDEVLAELARRARGGDAANAGLS
jgi:tetratricopeptide (TPR) repeat protein